MPALSHLYTPNPANPPDSISEANTGHLTYLCPMLGIITRYYIPALPTFKNKISGGFSLTRADLIATNSKANWDTLNGNYRYPMPTIMATSTNPGYYFGSMGYRWITNNDAASLGVSAITYSMNTENNTYDLPMTRYIGSVIAGTQPSGGIYLTYDALSGYASPYAFFCRSVLKANTNDADRLKVRMYYVKF